MTSGPKNQPCNPPSCFAPAPSITDSTTSISSTTTLIQPLPTFADRTSTNIVIFLGVVFSLWLVLVVIGIVGFVLWRKRNRSKRNRGRPGGSGSRTIDEELKSSADWKFNAKKLKPRNLDGTKKAPGKAKFAANITSREVDDYETVNDAKSEWGAIKIK